jgi:hypothetical protein
LPVVDLVLKNGKIITGTEIEGGLAEEAGQIVAMSENVKLSEADTTVDLHGCYVMPGAIDSHCHCHAMGRFHNRHDGCCRRSNHDNSGNAAPAFLNDLRREKWLGGDTIPHRISKNVVALVPSVGYCIVLCTGLSEVCVKQPIPVTGQSPPVEVCERLFHGVSKAVRMHFLHWHVV